MGLTPWGRADKVTHEFVCQAGTGRAWAGLEPEDRRTDHYNSAITPENSSCLFEGLVELFQYIAECDDPASRLKRCVA
jgi:hypothetical protein